MSDIVRSWTFGEVRQQYERRDVILYALGLGLFPADTLRMEMWRHSDTISFRMRSLERDIIALAHGRAVPRS